MPQTIFHYKIVNLSWCMIYDNLSLQDVQFLFRRKLFPRIGSSRSRSTQRFAAPLNHTRVGGACEISCGWLGALSKNKESATNLREHSQSTLSLAALHFQFTTAAAKLASPWPRARFQGANQQHTRFEASIVAKKKELDDYLKCSTVTGAHPPGAAFSAAERKSRRHSHSALFLRRKG